MATNYELGLKYELARELIAGRMSKIAAELGQERAKSPIDPARIAALKEQSSALFLEREELRSDDEAAVLSVIARYRRPPADAPLPAMHAAG